MQEWPIKDVAQATGLTSRTLRHYEQLGLLRPSRVASNGYRFYGETELSRLYRILTLRALELPLAAIRLTLDDEQSLAGTMQAHLSLLEARRDHTEQQITIVRQTLQAVQKGNIMNIDDVFEGFDESQYETEVRQRWGDDAWERSARRREGMNDLERAQDNEKSIDVTAALREAADSGVDPSSAPFHALIAEHYAWVTDHWGGRKPSREAYTGLSHLYVSDPRFAASYGGQSNAEIIRMAMQAWMETNLA